MQDFGRILRNLPEKPARSRLEPYTKLIKELLRHHRTYREIAQILAAECQLRVSISTFHDFVRLRLSTKRNSDRSPALKEKTKAVTATATARLREKEPLSAEGEPPVPEDVYRRIAELKQHPAWVAKTVEAFQYDPEEPLQLPAKTGPKGPGK